MATHSIHILMIIILFDLSTSQDDPLVISCPDDASIQFPDDTSPSATEIANCTDATDPYPVITHSDTITTTTCDLDTISRTWTCTNTADNPVHCSQTITVTDTTAPDIICPDDIIIDVGDNTDPTQTGTVSCTDIADSAPEITFSDDVIPALCGTGFIIDRHWTCSDCSGNVAKCYQLINVEDNIPPVISGCPVDTVVGHTEVPSPTVINCTDPRDAPVLITFSEDFISCDSVTRIWVCMDECEHTDVCAQVITINCPIVEMEINPVVSVDQVATTLTPISDPTSIPIAMTALASSSDESDDDDSIEYAANALFNEKIISYIEKHNVVDENTVDITLDNKTMWNLVAMCILFVFVNGFGCIYTYYHNETKSETF